MNYPSAVWPGMLLAVLGFAGSPAVAQSQFPPCAPPTASEYLLLVRGETTAVRDRIQEQLPDNSTSTVCNYLNDVVVRAGGFTSLETANAWAQYMTETEGLQAFVARPPMPDEATAALATPTLNTVPTYAPQPLSAGYAVLVDYFDRPEVAFDLQQALNQPVGLAVYRQQPYLLVTQSADVTAVGRSLAALSDRNFTTFIVDSSQVMLLSAQVASVQPQP
ncbi:MAG: hypothetical protein HC886_04130 [Leptolyngbyaceae cyanobacterium SM1_1_3]|nr:hypothetical protein [Leptolyngbyaceae cyanobacterium SM1_1_3]NJN03011.1 hypothetical protein [Leptolyngbyaceae cyanobacterium RM1_1_2]NJO08366.1 hypothetical protein [Leptolyngbyaceae cyanobacterium SL_1_1]